MSHPYTRQLISSGTKLGPYAIDARLGAGGMGEVYRAYDTRLGRHVAIKVLAAHAGTDTSMRKRLVREARAISAISHPNICALYDIGSENGFDYLVMELLEGRTLADVLADGPLAPEEALTRAIEIAAALEHAHRKGIVHRDLKPGNVIITKSGAKLLDFGLARLLDATESAAPLTADNAILGTIEYMAPEQLNGAGVDARADIFSFGVVLYEMLTGQRPFGGATRASVIGSILFSSPEPVSAHTTDLPNGVEPLLHACLQKDPDDRLQTAHDLLLQLRWIREGTFPATAPVAPRRKLRRASWLAVAAALLAGIAIGAGVYKVSSRQHQPQLRFAISPRPGERIHWAVLSPDRQKIAYVVETASGRRSLWMRTLASAAAREMPGTTDALTPFWSPDSQAIAFFQLESLRVIELEASAPRAVAEVLSPRGGSWSASGNIIYTPQISESLYVVPGAGGTPRKVTTLEEGDTTHRWPEFLPGSDRFLFVISSRKPGRSGLYLGELSSSAIRKVATTEFRATGVGDHLLFISGKRLYAQEFDADGSSLEGRPQLLAENVATDPKITGAAAFSAPSPEMLAFVTTAQTDVRLVWTDLSGADVGTVAPAGQWVNPNISPDGRHLAVARIDPDSGKYSLWHVDLTSGTTSRLIVDDNNADAPVWSADSKRVYFASDRRGRYEIYEKNVETNAPERMVESGEGYTHVVSARRAALLYHTSGGPNTPQRLWYWPAGGGRPAVVDSPQNEGSVDLSPDGKWLAYQRRDQATGTYDVFVMSIDDPTVKRQISNDGGAQTTWSADGRKLYYVRPDKMLMVTDFDSGRAGTPRPLFRLDVALNFNTSRDYVPAPDGKRILTMRTEQNADPGEIHILMNWLNK